MSWQTKAMYVFQSAVIIAVSVVGVLAISATNPAIKGLLAGTDIGLIAVDVVGIILYARYVNRA